MYAGFWNRFAAFFFDYLVLLIPLIVLNFLFGLMGAIMAMLGSLVILIGIWLYEAFLLSSASQATVGKMILRVKVTDLEGNPISFLRATGRFWSKYIGPLAGTLIMLIGSLLGPLAIVFLVLGLIVYVGPFVMAAFSPQRRALHDLIASTIVVDRDTAPGTEPSGIKPGVGWAITTAVAVPMTLVFTMFFGAIFLGLSAISGMSGAATAMNESSGDFAAQGTILTAASLAESTKFAVEQYAQTHDGIYPSNSEELAAAGMGIAGEFPGITVSIGREGEIVAVIDSPPGELRYTPKSEGGLTTWTCKGTGVDDAYLPDDCTSQ